MERHPSSACDGWVLGRAELRDGAVVDLLRKEEHLSDDEFVQVPWP